MKCIIKVASVTGAALLILALTAAASLYWSGTFLPGQLVNGEDASWQKKPTIEMQVISDAYVPFVIKANDEEHRLFSVTDVDVITWPDQSIIEWVRREPITFDVKCVIDYDKLREIIEHNYSPSRSASIVCENGVWKMIPSVQGYDIDVDAVMSMLQESGDFYIDLDYQRVLPEFTEEDLQEDFDKVEWLNTFFIEYTCGASLYGTDLSEYVTDYTLELPDEVLQDFVKSVVDFYDTTDGQISVYNPATESTITANRKTWGQKVDTKKEVNALRELVDSHTSETRRQPIVSGYETINDTYVLVSIDDQHLWYVKDGELKSETDVVTGRKGVHDTPRGAYFISECIPGKNLVGDDYVTWVNRWMRLTNSGVGLHDAGWRSSFGKDIYTYNGSHGCINLPKSFAYEFYKDSYVGMPVIIY